jgi:hypothetical protein
MTKPNEDWKTIHEMIRKLSDYQLGALFREYYAESAHQGFDGFTSRDLTGIRKFLVDMELYNSAKLEETK